MRYRRQINWGKLVLGAVIAGILLFVGLFFWFSRGLPDPNKVERKSGYSSAILDKTGKEILYNLYVDENRKFVPIAEVPEYLKQATIAIEDKEFYTHNGFDPLSWLRIAKNLVLKRRLIGGSTLTQQLVKNMLLSQERTITRKIKEFFLAVRIEKKFTKDEILQMYLNESPYGGTAWGVAAGAQQYFGKEVKDLTLVESVVLAGLPQSPSRYSPFTGKDKAYLTRAKDVARRMREDNYITAEVEKELLSQLDQVKFKPMGSSLKAPHFVMYVRQLLESMYGATILEKGGLKITTTLDWDLQQKAEAIVKEEVDKVSKTLNISNGASVMIDPNNGEILSMVGSKDFFSKEIDGEVNVTTRPRQPGSSIKPLVYATAFEKGYSPASVLADVETEFPGGGDKIYSPKNYDGKEHGLLHLRESLGSSINIPAVKLVALVGVENVLKQAYKMGLTTLEPTKDNLSRLGLSMALGGGEIKLMELVSAYGSFANGGNKVTPVAILKIEDASGKVLFEHKQTKPEKVLNEKVAFLVNSVLSDNKARLLTFGPNSYLNLGSRAVAVKTGTTNDLRDNWTVGWSRDVVVGVWVGNNNNDKMKNVASGVSGAAPIWRREIMEFLTKKTDRPFDQPSGVIQIDTDVISGYPAHDNFPSYKEWFIEGTVPTGSDPIHKKIKVCKNDGNKLADTVLVAQGSFDEREVIAIQEKDPLTPDNWWQKGIDKWVAAQTDQKYKVPTEYCQGSDSMDVQIITPQDRSRVDGDSVTIRFEVSSTKSLSYVDLYIDGVNEQRFEKQPYTLTRKLTTGIHKIRVVARNIDGKESDRIIDIGVNTDWVSPTPTPTATTTPTSTPTP